MCNLVKRVDLKLSVISPTHTHMHTHKEREKKGEEDKGDIGKLLEVTTMLITGFWWLQYKCIHMSKLIKLYTLIIYTFFLYHYTSIKLGQGGRHLIEDNSIQMTKKHTKRCSTLLAIMIMYKTVMRCHYIIITVAQN